MTLDIEAVVGRINLALKDVAGADIPVLSRYGEAKARAVAQYADLIADAYAAGALDEHDMKREIDEIEHMTRRFTRNLKGFAGVTAERAAREAVGVVLAAMRAGLSYVGSPLPAGLIDPRS
jgi:tetrahydromethanopterin S-methyltransferase subunit F